MTFPRSAVFVSVRKNYNIFFIYFIEQNLLQSIDTISKLYLPNGVFCDIWILHFIGNFSLNLLDRVISSLPKNCFVFIEFIQRVFVEYNLVFVMFNHCVSAISRAYVYRQCLPTSAGQPFYFEVYFWHADIQFYISFFQRQTYDGKWLEGQWISINSN